MTRPRTIKHASPRHSLQLPATSAKDTKGNMQRTPSNQEAWQWSGSSPLLHLARGCDVYILQRLGCFCTSRSSVVCLCSILNLFLLYSTTRILYVRFLRYVKIQLGKTVMISWKMSNTTWKLGSSPSSTFQLPQFRVNSFCLISIKFGMNGYLVALYAGVLGEKPPVKNLT